MAWMIISGSDALDVKNFEEAIMLIAIDHGNYAIKSADGDSFVSGLSQHSVPPPLATDTIEWDGKFWTLTESRIPYMKDKTKDDRFFILSLFAIARELKEQGEMLADANIDLAVGLPPEHLSTLKDKFLKYFKRESVKFKYNGMPLNINIRRVFVYPQAYAAVVPQSRLLISTPRLFVIDIGGFTIDVLMLRNGKPDLLFCRSLEIGVIAMNNEIIGRVGSLHDIKVEDDHINAVIQGRDTILPESVIKTIWDSTKCHADTILNKLRELQVDLRSTPAIFIGGGSILYRKYIESSPMVVKADFITDTRANAIGYAMLATSQLQKLSANGGNNGNA